MVAVTTRTFFGAAAERVIAASRQPETKETVFMVRMKTGDGTLLVSQSGQRKGKPLERSRNPFATTIAEEPVLRTIAVINGFCRFRATERPSLPLRIGASHDRNPPSGTCMKTLLPRVFGKIVGWLPKTSA